MLDIAGGKGELAFELLNLNDIPATVVEPRRLELGQFVRWAKVSLQALCLRDNQKPQSHAVMVLERLDGS